MILNRARANADALKIKVPNDSVDMILARLRSIRADRREGANAWVVKPIAKKAAGYALAAWFAADSKNSPATLSF